MNEPSVQKAQYQESLKATGITGLAQVAQILIKIVNTKVIAILLGPSGVGIIGLFQSTTSLIGMISGLGLGSSAVRDIAQAVKQEDGEKISHTLITLRRLVWITGLLGALFCLFAGPWLSRISFNSEIYATEFRIMGVVVFLFQITAGQMALLQGLRRLKEMAMASVLGGLAGIIFAVPLYWYFGIKGIVPALVILAIVPVGVAWWLARGIHFTHHPISMGQLKQFAIPMIRLGISTMLSGLVFLLSMWLIRILVQRKFGTVGVGQFQAGWGVTTIYLQMIFQAMGRDYYPRLSALSGDKKGMVKLLNEQINLALLLGTPLLINAIVAAPLIIQLLYSSGFENAISQLRWLSLGTMFKLISWPLGFVLLAMRKSGTYFFVETFASVALLAFSFLFINYFGINGIGMAYTGMYILYALLVYFLSKSLISVRLDFENVALIFFSVLSSFIVFYSFNYNDIFALKIISILICCSVNIIYLRILNKKSNFFKFIWSLFRK